MILTVTLSGYEFVPSVQVISRAVIVFPPEFVTTPLILMLAGATEYGVILRELNAASLSCNSFTIISSIPRIFMSLELFLNAIYIV